MIITRNVATHDADLIALAARASSRYDAFVYDNEDQAKTTHELLFDAGDCEYSPPFAFLVMVGDRLIAMAAAMCADRVLNCRLRIAMALSRTPWFARGTAPRRRSQLASQTFMTLQSAEGKTYYVTRLAVHESARRKGVAGLLMDRIEKEARIAGAARLALDVSPDHEAAIRFYERAGFHCVGSGEARDEATARSLTHLHYVKLL